MRFSFIIPTYNRAEKTLKMVQALVHAIEYAKADAEIIVVDNNSSDNTLTVLSEYKHICPVTLHVLVEKKQGVNNARNAGLLLSKGELINLLDDDCYPKEDYVAQIQATYEKDDEPVFRGCQVALGDDTDWPMTIKMFPDPQRWKLTQPELGYLRTCDIVGCSMIFPRTIFEKVGLFDPIFCTKYVPGGNDTEYGLRVYLAGFAIEYIPQAIVYHFHGRNTEGDVRKLVKKYCIGGGANYARFLWRHPHVLQRLSQVPVARDQRKAVSEVVEDKRAQDLQKMIGDFYMEYRKEYFLRGFFGYYRALFAKCMKRL